MNPTDFGDLMAFAMEVSSNTLPTRGTLSDPMTRPLAPPPGHNINFSMTSHNLIFQDEPC